MDIYFNGEVFVNGANLILDSMDLSALQTGIDSLTIIGIFIALILALDLARKIWANIRQ